MTEATASDGDARKQPATATHRRPRLCVAMRWFGVRSEVWAWRQIRLFSRVRPEIISWTHENADDFPLGEVPIRLLDTKEDPNEGKGRWWWRVRNLPSGNFYGTQGEELEKIVAMWRESRPDVVLCHFGHVGLRFLPAARQLGIPVVVHFHGHDIGSGLDNRWYRWSLRRSLPGFAAAVCVGSHQRKRLIQLGMPEDRTHLIPCGVPTAEFTPPPRNPNNESLQFICVSRLIEWKGQHIAIDAFADIAEKIPGAKLVIVGDGPDEDSLRQKTRKLGVAERVEFTGSCSPESVKQHLRQSDVFLQHSLTHPSGWGEGFGVSIAEASSTGLPVVVTPCGGIADQVVDGETGIIVPERDRAAMARAMLELATSPDLRRQMGEAGRKRMAEQFDTNLQVEKLEDVLLRVCSRNT